MRLASATVTSMRGLRASIPSSHDPLGVRELVERRGEFGGAEGVGVVRRSLRGDWENLRMSRARGSSIRGRSRS